MTDALTVSAVMLKKAMGSAQKRYLKQNGRFKSANSTLSRICVQTALEIYRNNESFDDGYVIRLALNEVRVNDTSERTLYSKVIASYFGQLFAHARRNQKNAEKKPSANKRRRSIRTEVEKGSGQIAWQI